MDKITLREHVKKRILALDKAYIEESDHAITQKLISLPEFLDAPRIFSYISVGREVDTINFIKICLEQGKQVAAPLPLPGGAMDFKLLDRPLEKLSRGVFGIPVPPRDAKHVKPTRRDLIIVPALCYDEDFFRLGMGGGYYDRYLATCAAASIGLCRCELLFPSLPRDEFDVPVTCLVTEKASRSYECENKKIARPDGSCKNGYA